MMNFNEYMQIEIENGNKEKVVNLKNIINLDEDYEVALLDIMYDYTPFSLSQLTVSKNVIRKDALHLTLPNMKWRATRLNVFIPDLSFVKSATYNNYRFQHVWGEQKRLAGLPLFEEKHYFIRRRSFSRIL